MKLAQTFVLGPLAFTLAVLFFNSTQLSLVGKFHSWDASFRDKAGMGIHSIKHNSPLANAGMISYLQQGKAIADRTYQLGRTALKPQQK